jgi:putative lipoic acid-binding regulatory protein
MSASASPPKMERATLIDYPCDFPIKVMGINDPAFVPALVELAKAFDPQFNADTISLRESRQGTYQGVTLTVRATSQSQLDDLYRSLTSHPMVKVVL